MSTSVTIDFAGVLRAVPVIVGLLLLGVGVLREDPAALTAGAGLIGLAPASKGPVKDADKA